MDMQIALCLSGHASSVCPLLLIINYKTSGIGVYGRRRLFDVVIAKGTLERERDTILFGGDD